MDMEVKNALPGILAVIDDKTKGVADALLSCDFRSRQHEMAQECLILLRGIADFLDSFLGNDEYVDGRLGLNVLESHA